MFDAFDAQSQAGPSKPRMAALNNLPPTPPVHDDLTAAAYESSRLAFDSSPTYSETRYRSPKVDTTRRPHSTYPTPSEEPVFHPHRKYTDPTPHTAHYPMHEPVSPIPSGSGNGHTLDVDLDVYSGDYDLDDEVRQPTLSFVTTSTVDSTTSSPSITDAYTYASERVDSKPDLREPRIRVRAGRQNAYSSAESSMASGGYSYHAYSDNSYHQTPPVPVIPTDMLNARPDYGRQSSNADVASSYTDNSSWQVDAGRDRSNSTSSALSTDMSSEDDRISSSFAHTFSYLQFGRQPWDDEQSMPLSEPNALAMVGDGRSIILDAKKLDAMGGIHALRQMTENELLRLPRYTHLLLSGIGPEILSILAPLLDVLSTTLVVLDVSNNDLTAIPSDLRHCSALEELNVSNNQIRLLPSFIGDCTSLRVIVADNCALSGLPVEISQLTHLHSICVRHNRLIMLPSWLCLLTQLDTLRIDNNPFAPEWTAIVTPILAATLSSHQRNGSHQSLRSIRLASGMSSVASSIGGQHTPSTPASDAGVGLGISQSSSQSQTPSRSSTPFQSLRTTRSLGKRADSIGRAPNRSVTNPNPASEVFSAGTERFLPTRNSRRVQSAVGSTYTDDSEGEDKPKWGFLRKVSMSRLRSDKGTSSGSAKISASAAANVASMPSVTSPTPSINSTMPRRPSIVTTSAWSSTSAIPDRRVSETPDGLPVRSPSAASQAPNSLSTSSVFGSLRQARRRSFLPIDPAPPSLNVAIPSTSPFMSAQATLGDVEHLPMRTADDAMETLGDGTDDEHEHRASKFAPANFTISDSDDRYTRGLESIKSYLRDLYDLSLPPGDPYGGFEVIESDAAAAAAPGDMRSSMMGSTSRHMTPDAPSRGVSMVVDGKDDMSTPASSTSAAPSSNKRFKDDKGKRARVIREILETEKTYVRGLTELVAIYVRPASQPVNSAKSSETVIPVAERKVVFGGVESVLVIHRDNVLPALTRTIQPLLDQGDDDQGELSARIAHQVGEVFRTYIAYMKQYSTYINNFDNALARMRSWTAQANTTGAIGKAGAVGVAAVGAGLVGSAVMPAGDSVPHSGSPLTPSQRKRVKQFLKRAKEDKSHSQINFESYLLLPVQRVPRYKLLLEDLAMCTPPRESIGPSDALDDAISEITNLASLMNEEKREAESRLRLLHWQQRISSRGPSPLVQPHRKLILDGALTLVRVVKKSSAFAEVETPVALNTIDGDSTITTSKAVVPVDFISPEPMDKPIMLILCSDMLVLVQKRSTEGWDGQVDLFSVLRMATLREPASVSTSNDRVLRVVDNKSIYYFNGGSASTTLQWSRAINGGNSAS